MHLLFTHVHLLFDSSAEGQYVILSPLLFMIVIMPLNHILRKYTAGYKLKKSQKNMYHNSLVWLGTWDA